MVGRPPKSGDKMPPRIWVDADHCTSSAMQELLSFASQARVMLTLVGSRSQPWPYTPFIRSVLLQPGFEVSDRIAGVVSAGDVVVTTNKALAAEAGKKKATALNPREESGFAGSLAQSLAKKRAVVPQEQ